ncbi:MAG: AI-2E family transporter [Deltaproteobacteria bacterium]|nr:AI-2E family transporter [Deltaproteobacteria bacterium]
MEKPFISKLFLAVLLGFNILLFMLAWTYLSAIVLAFLISSAFYPIFSRVKKGLKDNEIAASLLMTLLIMMILIVPVSWFIGALSNEAFDFYNRTKNSVTLQEIQQGILGDSVWAQRVRNITELANIELNPQNIQELTTAIGKNVGLFLANQLSAVASNLLGFLVNFFLMMLIVYYIFRDGERLKNYIMDLLPFPAKQQELVVNKFREMGRAVIFGNVLSGTIQGILGGFGFFLFDLGSPLLWGTIIGFLAFLPIIGASVVFIPTTIIILLIKKNIGIAVGYLLYNMAYSSIIEYFFKPRFIGKGMRMNPILVFIGILGGLKLFGILGIIYGPLIITIFITLAEIYRLEYSDTVSSKRKEIQERLGPL